MWLGFFTHTRRPPSLRTTSSSGTSTSSTAFRRRSSPRNVFCERVGLLLVAWEAVEQEAVARVALAEPLGDHADDHVVGHELACVHVALRLLAQLGSLGDLAAEDVTGRDVGEPESSRRRSACFALPGARRTEQDQVELGQDPGQDAVDNSVRPQR